MVNIIQIARLAAGEPGIAGTQQVEAHLAVLGHAPADREIAQPEHDLKVQFAGGFGVVRHPPGHILGVIDAGRVAHRLA